MFWKNPQYKLPFIIHIGEFKLLATHNPNIPVLADADQILVCEYSNNKISIQSGSIDSLSFKSPLLMLWKEVKKRLKSGI